MADFWFAECNPCKWEEKHTDEDAAIRAAEDHVFALHRSVPNLVRAEQRMGHVQNRTENAVTRAPEDAIDIGSGASRFLPPTTPAAPEWPIELGHTASEPSAGGDSGNT